MNIKKEKIPSLLSHLAEQYEVYVPGEARGMKEYVRWEGQEVTFAGENADFPPKDILFPKTEKMYTYTKGEDAGYTVLTGAPRRCIFGLRPCDVHSFMCMDQVFLKDGYEDSFYSARRKNSLLVAVSCPQSGENCFCEAMELSPNAAPGADLFLADGGDFYTVKAQTEKGSEELKLWDALLEEGEEAHPDVHNTLRPAMQPSLSDKLVEHFDDKDFWAEFSDPCLHCGTCASVCPTCYCFDIANSDKMTEGTTFRCWDSCMFSDYSMHAKGFNPRPTKLERLRNRYLHKLSYFRKRYGMYLCAGCGRCIGKCPAHLDISEFIDKAAEVLE